MGGIFYRFKVWKSPKYEAYTKKGKPVNERSYVCEVLAPLININYLKILLYGIYGKYYF